MPLGPVADGATTIVHCAAVHAPHVGQVPTEDFVQANVVATGRLLDVAQRVGVSRFVFTSTTSVYGHALEDPDRAVWVDETLQPSPRDIYDETKLEAETLVEDHHSPAMGTITLRVGRCFAEAWRTVVVNRLYRGVDLVDVIAALRLAIDATPTEHHRLNIAGPRLFRPEDCEPLRTDPATVIAQRVPWLAHAFHSRGWPLPSTIDRVYSSDRAADILGYRPTFGVRHALAATPPDTD